MDRKNVLAMLDAADLRLLYEVVNAGVANMRNPRDRRGPAVEAEALKRDVEQALILAGGK